MYKKHHLYHYHTGSDRIVYFDSDRRRHQQKQTTYSIPLNNHNSGRTFHLKLVL